MSILVDRNTKLITQGMTGDIQQPINVGVLLPLMTAAAAVSAADEPAGADCPVREVPSAFATACSGIADSAIEFEP